MQNIHNKKRPFPSAVTALQLLFLLCIVLYSHYSVVATDSNGSAQLVNYDFSGDYPAIVEPFHLFLACLQQGQ